MADTLFTMDFTGIKPLIQAKKAFWESLNYMFWGKWMTFNTKDGKPVDPNAGIKPETKMNSPIVMQREFADRTKPVIELWVPMFRQLKSLPKYGKSQLSGMEEERYINMSKLYIDVIRHGEKVRQGSLSAHALQAYGIPESSKTALMMHYARLINNVEIPHAFYTGFSKNVVDSNQYANYSNIKHVSHPNFFVVGGGGQVAYTTGYPTSAGYETDIATAVAGLQPSHKLSAAVLKSLNAMAKIRKIPYLTTKNGKKFRVMVVDPYGMYDLQNDSEIKTFYNEAQMVELQRDNPMLSGCEVFYAGWAVFDGGHAVWPVVSSGVAGTMTYGPSTIADLESYEDYSEFTTFGAMILGDNAIAGGVGWDLKWTGETRDHNDVEAIGYNIGNGFARNEFCNNDDGTAGQYVRNESSAILAYSTEVPKI